MQAAPTISALVVFVGVLAFVNVLGLALNAIIWSRLMATKQEVLDKIATVSAGVDRLIAQGGGTGPADLDEVLTALDPVLAKLPSEDTFGQV